MRLTINNPMPPMWMMCPHIGLGSIGWRTGFGEAYAEIQTIWYSKLTDSEKQEYQEMFPPPKAWSSYYNINYGFEDVISATIECGIVEYSREKLIEKYNTGELPEYLFFWKPDVDFAEKPSLPNRICNFFGYATNDFDLYKQEGTGVVDKSCLSQWQPSPFYAETNHFCCAEQYMMAEKARLFDHDVRKLIMKSSNPNEMKALGRKIKNFKQEVWDREKYSIVTQANYYKFTQNDEMRNFLISTGNKVLVETSPFDTIWGIGLSESDDRSQNPNNWQGQSLLGFALMDVRDDLRKVYRNYDKINWSIFNSKSDWIEFCH